MKKSAIVTTLLLLGFISGGCSAAPPQTETPTLAVEPRILISEVLAGVEGNNQYEFIELYNAGSTVLDLQGWSLWYRLPTGEESFAVKVWQELALIPPHGHYLLGQVDQDLTIAPDATFTQALNTSGGGLELRTPDGTRADARALVGVVVQRERRIGDRNPRRCRGGLRRGHADVGEGGDHLVRLRLAGDLKAIGEDRHAALAARRAQAQAPESEADSSSAGLPRA